MSLLDPVTLGGVQFVAREWICPDDPNFQIHMDAAGEYVIVYCVERDALDGSSSVFDCWDGQRWLDRRWFEEHDEDEDGGAAIYTEGELASAVPLARAARGSNRVRKG